MLKHSANNYTYLKFTNNKNDIMKTLITLTAILVITLSALLITGLNNYRLAINKTQKCEGSDGEITYILYQHGFDLDVFETPTTIDYIKSPFKYSNFK